MKKERRNLRHLANLGRDHFSDRLLDDGLLSHKEVVSIVRAVLADGAVSADELADLLTVASTSKSIPPRSRMMLRKFVSDVKGSFGNGTYSLALEKQRFAADMACDFLLRSGRSQFPVLDRDEVGVGLLMRIANPGLIHQGSSSTCGPASLLYSVAFDNPGMYARFAIDLYEKGEAKIGRLRITPGKHIRNYDPPIDAIDWLTLASTRDSENWFLDYDTAAKEFAGATTPFELARWFQQAGFSDVQNETNVVRNVATSRGLGTVDDANELFAKGYRVALLIAAQLLKTKKQDQYTKDGNQSDYSYIPDHWVVQRSTIDYSGDIVNFKVFTYGNGDRQVPHDGVLTVDDFLKNFYGFVAARP